MSKNFKLRIIRDEDPISPREWDNVGTIVARHWRYNLGDDNAPEIDWSDFDCWEAVEQHLRDEYGATVVLPVYLYDHSGLALSTTPFTCRWDSGRVGAIYATADSVASILGNADVEAVREALRAEVEEYNRYVEGDVWGFVVQDPWGHVVDSCFGFYDKDDAENQGQASLQHHIEHAPKPCAQLAPACS
jgi:hypothetical protein